MKIRLKLYASLADYLPEEAKKTNQVELEVRDGVTISEVTKQHRLPPELVHLVLINGFYIPPDERQKKTFHEGDTLAIWPPVAGG